MSSPAAAEAAAPAGAIAATTADVATAAAAVPVAARPAPGRTLCLNCGAPLAGRYCSECGQRHHDLPIHDFWQFVREATEDLTHADSRLWRTVFALLFRPGFLTREFLDGRRARYLPPVRLYLVVSVIFFVSAGLESQLSSPHAVIVAQQGTHFSYQVVPAAPGTGGLGAAAHTRADATAKTLTGLGALAQTPAGRQSLCEQSATYIEQHWGWLAGWGPRVRRSCLTAVAAGGPERLEEAFTHNLERAMFLLLPLLALAMKPLYLEPPRHYVEHLLFFLHNHALFFVVFGAIGLLALIPSSDVLLNPVATAMGIYIPIYYYRAMRRVYGQSVWLTLSKLAALGVAYLFLGVLMLAATFSFSFLTL